MPLPRVRFLAKRHAARRFGATGRPRSRLTGSHLRLSLNRGPRVVT